MKFLGSITLLLFGVFVMSGVNVSGQTAERINLDPVDNKKYEDAPIKRAIKGEFILPEIANTSNYVFGTTTTGTLTDMSSGTTQLLAGNVDDTASPVTNIGFDFFFQGARYTTFSINENGVLRLTGTQASTPYQPLAQAGVSVITAYGADQRTHTTGKVHFKVIGSAPNRTLVIEWLNTQSNFNSGGTADLTYQVRLNETTGTIEFVYGSMTLSALGAGDANSNDPQIGFSSTNTAGNVGSVTAAQSGVPAPTYNGASAVPVNNIYTAGSITVLSSVADGSRRTFSFAPAAPTAPPGAPNLTAITATSQTVNWTDASSNEALFAVYRSTDNVNFTFAGSVPENGTSFNDTGLNPSTNYFYRIFAVTEGALSAAATVSGPTGAPGNDTCNGAGGNWSNPGTWTDGSVPTAGDNATIGAGCTVTIDAASTALNVIVQNGGTLQYEQAAARTLTVGGNVTIDAGGTFQSNPAGTVTTHVLSVLGNITNNGTLDFSTNANTAAASITFAAGPSDVTFSGSGATTDVRAITVAKGAQARIVELSTDNFTVRGVNTDVAGYLTLTSGTFKISGTFTITNRTFTGATWTIPALAGLWLNNPNYTIAGTASGTTSSVSGAYRLTQGTHNVGLTGADGLGGAAGGTFLFEGGTFNSPRFDPQNAVTFTMTGGVINIGGVAANTRSNFGAFELFSGTSSFTMSGGTINLIQPTVAATPIDWQVLSGTFNVTGGIVNVGTAATVTNFNFRIRGNAPNVTIDNTGTPKTLTATGQSLIRGNLTINPGTTLALNGQLVAPAFASTSPLTVTNNGAITGNVAGSRLYFGSTGPAVTYTGTGTAGTTGSPLVSVDFDSSAGGSVALGSAANQLITNRVILFSGNVTGSSKLTLGDGGATTGTTQIGNTTTATPVGTFDVPFTFNLGTGGQVTSYLRTTTPYTTGAEINPTRTLTSMNVDNNVTALNIAGGNITITGGMTLTNGVVNTGNDVIIHNGTATRTNGFVDGNLARDYTAPGVYTFFVGDGAYSPVLVNVTAVGGAGASRLTARAFDATLQGFNPPTSLSRNWLLEEAGDITADLSFTYDVDANDVNGNEADYRVYSRNSADVVTNHCPGGPCVNTGTNTLGPILGVTNFSRWTGAENQVVVSANASISGQVRTQSGNGIRNATVIISGGELTEPRMVQTGAFGLYEFNDLPVGRAYTVEVVSKRFFISNPIRTIVLQDNLTNLDFVSGDNPKQRLSSK